MRGDYEIVGLDQKVGDLHVGKIQRQGSPVVAVVPRDVDTVLGAGIEKAAAFGILAHGMHEVVTANAANDLRPCLSVVMGAVKVRSAVVVLIVLGGEVRGARVVRRRVDEADGRESWQS